MLRMEEAMIKEVYNYLLKLNSGILVIIIMAFIIMLIMAKPHLIKALKEWHKKRVEKYESIFTALEEIKKMIRINNEGTKACLYYDLDGILTRAEVLGSVWSSQIHQIYKNMEEIYNDLGDGMDKGDSLKSRASEIVTSDVLYHEKISKYNENKKKLSEES